MYPRKGDREPGTEHRDVAEVPAAVRVDLRPRKSTFPSATKVKTPRRPVKIRKKERKKELLIYCAKSMLASQMLVR